jgi:hypothetical protein
LPNGRSRGSTGGSRQTWRRPTPTARSRPGEVSFMFPFA